MVGGGGGGESTSTEKWEGAPWTVPWWDQLFAQGGGEGTIPGMLEKYNQPGAFQYQGERVASEDPWHDYAAGKIGQVNESPYASNVDNWLNQTITGANTQGPGQDWAAAERVNPYEGNSAQFEQTIANAKKGLTDNYKDVVAPGEAANATLAGAFGGGAHLQQQGRNQSQLMDKLGQVETGMRNDQFNRSGLLADNRLNRTAQMWGDERNRQLQGVGAFSSRQQQELANAMAAMGVGDLYRGIDQQQLGADQQYWQEGQMGQAQYVEMLMNALQRASGMAGSSVSSTPGYSPLGALAGAGLFGSSFLG
jgi:hypothetical protein